jgi:anti-anti-sigma factor
MEIKNISRESVTIIQLSGNLDGNTANQVQEEISPLITDSGKLILEMSGCHYVSSAGLRVLLMLAKQTTAKKGKLAICDLLEEVKDVMDMTGFINFFIITDTMEAALLAVKS